jgi:hypothetical protein
MRRVAGFLTRYVRGKGKTLKYEFAVAAFAVWVAVTVRLFISTDPAWIAAQGVNYGALTTTVFLYITASVITQVVQNRDGGTPPAGRDGEFVGDQVQEADH